jgi:hypothetical protein
VALLFDPLPHRGAGPSEQVSRRLPPGDIENRASRFVFSSSPGRPLRTADPGRAGWPSAAERPLTRKEVVRAIKDAGARHGAGTVAKALADPTPAGGAGEPARQAGYRLPEWPRRRETRSLFH